MPAPIIHGLVMARNEWPLLEVSVTHALVHHVDRVHVMDHGSTDDTRSGLERMRRVWGDRLAVIHLGEGPYLQEAATCLLRELVTAAPDDWLYVFDADEFGIADPASPLRDVLADVGPRHAAARYEVHNWVAPADFSAADVARYVELRFRAVAPLFLPVPVTILVDEILAGAVNYFDVPFEAKVIVRASAAGWIAAGSHGLAGATGTTEARLPPAAFRVAHLPLLDRRRLEGRVAQGRSYIDNGFPSWHGWQSQMLVQVAERGGLDAFWSRHSLVPARTAGSGEPQVTVDDTLAVALAPTVARVIAARRDTVETVTAGTLPQADATLLLPAALRTIRRLQADVRHHLDVARAEADSRRPIEAARAAAIAPHQEPAAGRQSSLRRLASLVAGRFSRPRTSPDAHEPTGGPEAAADDRAVIPMSAACQRPPRAKRPAA